MAQGSPESAERYQEARRTVASVVTKAKIRVWEEYGEVIEKDLRLASRKFWRTTRQLRKGKQSWPRLCSAATDDPDKGYCQAMERAL